MRRASWMTQWAFGLVVISLLAGGYVVMDRRPSGPAEVGEAAAPAILPLAALPDGDTAVVVEPKRPPTRPAEVVTPVVDRGVAEPEVSEAPQPAPAPSDPIVGGEPIPHAAPSTPPVVKPSPTEVAPARTPLQSARLIEAAERAESAGQWIEARSAYSEALAAADLDPAIRQRLLQRAIDLANRTLFTRESVPGDPLVSTYEVKSGDHLGAIARNFKVTPELLGRINGLRNINAIRIGQKLKVLQGPFHARIYKRDHTMVVLLGELIVGQYPVGLGQHGSTPTGEWKIKDKLVNPTYYPPEGGAIVMADDPENPLGERWLALHGLSGEALGQEAYGIHGTIEPESIGQDASLGCVRMINENVEFVYDLLIVDHSHVTIE